MQEKNTVARSALKNGMIFGMICLLFRAVTYVFGLSFIPLVSYVVFIILGVGINLALKELRSDNEGLLSFGDALSLGALMSAVAGLILTTFEIVYVQFIDTAYNDKFLAAQLDAWQKQGMDERQIERAAAWTKMVLSPGFSFFVQTAGFVMAGFFIALVLGAIYRKNKPVFE